MKRIFTLLDKLWALWLLVVLAAYFQLIDLPPWLAIVAAVSLAIVVVSMIWRYLLAPIFRKEVDANG